MADIHLCDCIHLCAQTHSSVRLDRHLGLTFQTVTERTVKLCIVVYCCMWLHSVHFSVLWVCETAGWIKCFLFDCQEHIYTAILAYICLFFFYFNKNTFGGVFFKQVADKKKNTKLFSLRSDVSAHPSCLPSKHTLIKLDKVSVFQTVSCGEIKHHVI